MLATFSIRKNFNGLRVTLWVDCEASDATLTASFNRRIFLHQSNVPFHEVRTPELAEKYLSREVPDYREQGAVISFIESLEPIGRAEIARRDLAA